jgi:hypothetical protein
MLKRVIQLSFCACAIYLIHLSSLGFGIIFQLIAANKPIELIPIIGFFVLILNSLMAVLIIYSSFWVGTKKHILCTISALYILLVHQLYPFGPFVGCTGVLFIVHRLQKAKDS